MKRLLSATGGNGDEFDCQVATDSSFSNVIRSISDINTSSYTPSPPLPAGDRYYWRVRAKDFVPNVSDWSPYRYFDILAPASIELVLHRVSDTSGTPNTSDPGAPKAEFLH